MRDVLHLTRVLSELGWRVEVAAGGTPKLVPAVKGATLPAGVKRQLAAVRDDLIRLHTEHVCGAVKPAGRGDQEPTPCGATVSDGVALAAANQCGPGAGCPFAHCPYRG